VDASGFSHPTGGEWLSVKFKRVRKRRLDGLHNAVDTDTLLINAARVRVRRGGDARCTVALVRTVPKSNLKTVHGDKAYISRENVQFIHDVGAYAAIEPKENLTVSSRGHWAYGQLIREYRSGPEEWKRSHSYGRRSLAETVFSVMKQRNGECLSSRGHKQRRRELLIRVVLHNIERLNFLECAGR